MEKASLYLQYKFWTVRTTSMGFGCFSSWTTIFLWVHMVHSVKKMFYICSIKTSSSRLWETINSLNHCCTEIPIRSEVWTISGNPCQQALAKRHSRNRWDVDSSSQLHKGQRPMSMIPLFLSSCLVGRLSCISFQTKLQIFCGVFNFHISFQILFSTWGSLCCSLEGAR